MVKMNKLLPVIVVAFALIIIPNIASATGCGVLPVGWTTNYCAQLTIDNTQSSTLASNTQIAIPVNTQALSQNPFGTNMDNWVVYNSLSGATASCWLEGNTLAETSNSNLASSANILIWCKIPDSTPSTASDTNWYFGWASQSTNLFTTTNANIGEAPYLSSTYGQYDNGANVFSYYVSWGNLASLPTGWGTFQESGSFAINYLTTNTELSATSSMPTWGGINTLTPSSLTSYPNILDSLQASQSPTQQVFGYCDNTNTGNCANSNAIRSIGTGIGSCSLNSNICFSNIGSQVQLSETFSTTPSVYSIESPSASSANVYASYNQIYVATGLSTTLSNNWLDYAVSNQEQYYIYWTRARIAPPNNIQPTVTIGTVQSSSSQTLTINPNPAIYGQQPSITATFVPATDNGEILITGGIFGTSNIVATGTGSASYTMPIVAVGTYTVNSYDMNTLTSVVNTLTINRANTILAFKQQCSQLTLWASSGCTTTSNIISINNQVTGNVFVNANGLIANTFLLDSTTNQVSDNSIAVGNYTFTFNNLQTANYSANSINYQFYLYVPVASQNSLGTTALTPNTETIGSTQMRNYYPLKLYTTTPSNTLTYSLSQSKEGGASTQLQTAVSNIDYIPPTTQTTGNYVYTIQEDETNPYGQLSLTYNTFTNMTDITNTFTFNNPVIQYDANLANFSKGSFTALPSSWQIWSSPLTATMANTILGDQFQSGSLTIPVNVQLTYSFTKFNISLPNNPAVQTTITQNAMQFIATNSAPSNIITRKILNISTYSEGNFQSISANTTVSFAALYNNYTISGSVNFNANQFYVYMPLSNYQNPNIFVSNMVTTSKASNFFQAINNYCPSTIANGAVQQYKPYLVDAGGQLYTFQVYQGSGFTPIGYYMLVQESNGASSPQVQSYQIESSPFGLPLEVGIQYKFLFENPSCTSVVYQTPLSVWVSPISITIPQNNTIPAVQTIDANATCSESFNAVAGVNSVTCTGVDPHNFVTSWTIKLFNVTSVLNSSALLNETNISGSSFTWTHTLPNNNIIYHVQVIGNDAGGTNRYSQIILSWLSNLVTAPINPFAVTGAVIAVFAFFTLIFLGGTNKSMLIIFGVMILFILSTLNIIPMSAPSFFGILFAALILLFIFETDRL